MKKLFPASIRLTAIFIAITILFTACESTTLIQSVPTGATVYMADQNKGVTPYYHTDTKIVGTSTPVTLKKEGYQDFHTVLTRDEDVDVGAIIGGLFVLFPFLWVMKYDPIHTYELTKADGSKNAAPETMAPGNDKGTSNSTAELVKLKNLLDQGAITNDDFTTLKVKILNDKYDYSISAADEISKLKSLYDQKLLTRAEYESQKNKIINAK